MQVTFHVRRQALEPARRRTGGESRFERRGISGVMEDLGEKTRGGGGFEDGEDGRGRELGGEVLGYGAEGEEDGGVGGESGYAGEGGELEELGDVGLGFALFIGGRGGGGEGGEEESEKD